MPDPVEIEIIPKRGRGRPRKLRPGVPADLPPLAPTAIPNGDLLFIKNPLVHIAQRQVTNPEPKAPLTLAEFADAGKITRQKKTITTATEPSVSPLNRAKELLEKSINGGDLAGIKEKLGSLVANHRERSEILQILMAIDDQQNLVSIRSDMKRLMDFLHTCTTRGDLTVVETVALIGFLTCQEKTATERLEKSLSEQPKNSVETLERLCHSLSSDESRKQFKDITPHGREILRKLRFKIERKITETLTSEETVTEKR